MVFDFSKYKIELVIPDDILNFLKTEGLDESIFSNKNTWGMYVEDDVFFSHEKHPTEQGYEPFTTEDAPLSISKDIKIVIYEVSFSTKKKYAVEPEKSMKDKKPLATTTISYAFPKLNDVSIAYYD